MGKRIHNWAFGAGPIRAQQCCTSIINNDEDKDRHYLLKVKLNLACGNPLFESPKSIKILLQKTNLIQKLLMRE